MKCAHDLNGGACIVAGEPKCTTHCGWSDIAAAIARTSAPSAPTIYRHFDSEGRLLYVGMSLNVMRRTRSHFHSAAWWDEVATITIQRFETKADACAAELHAIRTEGPLHNRLGAVR